MMAKEVFPKLTEAQVRKLATPQSFERGQRYFKDGAIVEPLLQGNEVRAECAGSDDDPYELSVEFDKKGVAEMDCTCPYDQGGACKHLVALLLTCIHKPQAVRWLDSLDKMLAERGKEELIAIIKQMVKRDAKLLHVIELAVDYLKRARKLVSKLNDEVQWKEYLQNPCVRNPTLRALHEELSKARL
jgi:uncharacterized Zn finger protein